MAGVHASGAISTRLRKVMRDPIRKAESIGRGFGGSQSDKSCAGYFAVWSRLCPVPQPYLCGYGLWVRWMTRSLSVSPCCRSFFLIFPPRNMAVCKTNCLVEIMECTFMTKLPNFYSCSAARFEMRDDSISRYWRFLCLNGFSSAVYGVPWHSRNYKLLPEPGTSENHKIQPRHEEPPSFSIG